MSCVPKSPTPPQPTPTSAPASARPGWDAIDGRRSYRRRLDVLEHVRQNCAQLPSALRDDGAAHPHCSSVGADLLAMAPERALSILCDAAATGATCRRGARGLWPAPPAGARADARPHPCHRAAAGLTQRSTRLRAAGVVCTVRERSSLAASSRAPRNVGAPSRPTARRGCARPNAALYRLGCCCRRKSSRCRIVDDLTAPQIWSEAPPRRR